MSQAGIVDIEGSHPQIPTSFVTNMGTAIPIGNVLELLGTTVAAHGIPLETTGSGNTATVVAQYASAAASSVAGNAGFASFNSTYFTVDANGYVSFKGSAAIESFMVDASTAPGTNPVLPNGSGIVTITGGQVAAGTTANVLQTNSLAANSYTLQIQRSQAVASSTVGDNGVSHFNSAYFSVDANGFVSLTGTGTIQTITGNDLVAVPPTAGNFNLVGSGSITTSGNAGTSTETISLTGLTAHAVLVGAGTATITKIGPSGSTGQILQNNAAADPSYSTATYPSTTTVNQILYSSSANTIAGLATANNGVLITSASGVPSFLANGTAGQVLTATPGSPPSWENPATSGTVTSVSVVSANGFAGTVANATTTPAITLTTTQTGLLTGNGTSITGTAITQYNVLTAGATNLPNSVAPSSTSGVPLISQGAASQPVFGTVVVAGGGTGSTSFNTTGIVISGATSTTALSAITLTDGQLAIGSSAGNPAAATLTAGTGVTITNGHNSITISSSSAGFTWNDVTTTPTTMAAENGYIADSSSFLTFVLPTNNILGDTIKVVGKGTGLWTVITNGASSSYINFGSLSSTPSVGFLTSTNANDCIELVCTTASASSPIWTVVSSIGNITVG